MGTGEGRRWWDELLREQLREGREEGESECIDGVKVCCVFYLKKFFFLQKWVVLGIVTCCHMTTAARKSGPGSSHCVCQCQLVTTLSVQWKWKHNL